jgi:hypothetical protein
MGKKRTLRAKKKKVASAPKASKAKRTSKSTSVGGATRGKKKGATKKKEKEKDEIVTDEDDESVVILEPLPDDILLGRGPNIANHNQFTHFFRLVNRYRSAYKAAKANRLKKDIVNYIVKNSGGDDVSGRFLQRRGPPDKHFVGKIKAIRGKWKTQLDKEAGWYEVTDREIICSKTSQALREKKIAKSLLPQQSTEEKGMYSKHQSSKWKRNSFDQGAWLVWVEKTLLLLFLGLILPAFTFSHQQAQLHYHQRRGSIGRISIMSWCLLLKSQKIIKMMKILKICFLMKWGSHF